MIFSYPSGLYDASTMDGDEYALDVTQVQWTANIMSIISTATITIERMLPPRPSSGGNCIKMGLPGKSILGDYFQENMSSGRPFLLLRIRFPGRPIFIQFIPGRTRPR